MKVTITMSCSAPTCRAHVHVDAITHENQPIDVDMLGEAFGFSRAAAFARWFCRDHKREAALAIPVYQHPKACLCQGCIIIRGGWR